MKRRDVLKLGAVAAATTAVPGCATPKLVGDLHGDEGAAAFNAMLDEQLAKLETPGMLQRIAAEKRKSPLSPADHAGLAEKDATFRRMLSAVLVTQAFRELPEDTQRHPEVQSRMLRHLDAINDSVFEVSDMLAGLDANDRKRLRTELHKQPDMAMDVGEILDARAAGAGLSTARRRQLRQMMSATAFRLKVHDPSSVIDEYTEKVDKLRESSIRDATALEEASRIGEREFWRQQRMRRDDPGSAAPPAPAAPMPPASDPTVIIEPPPLSAVRVASMLTNVARQAAVHGNCHTVALLANRVREIDPEYFQGRFQNDPVIAGCKPGVVAVPRQESAPVEVHPGTKGLHTGGRLLGIGLLISVVSIPLIYVIIGLFTLTAGVIIMGIGLIYLYFNALIYVGEDV